MELRHLEAFAAVMSTGSFTAAARLLARSQPAITRLVQEFETEIGYPLFSRHGPRVTPTEQGFLLYEDAQRALDGLRQIHLRADEMARRAPQPMLVAATSALAVGLLPQAIARVEAGTGATPIQLRSTSPEQVVHAVLTGAAHIGASSLPLEHRGLQVHWIGQVACVAVLPAHDPLAGQPRVSLADLAQRRIVTMSNPYRLRRRLDQEMERAGPPSERRWALIETNSSVNAQALVRAGLGVAVLEPLTALGAPTEGVVVRPLDVDIPFYFGAITSQSRTVAAPELALVQALLEAATALPGFVQHDTADHNRLLQSLFGDRPDGGTLPTPERHPDAFASG